MLWNKNWDKKEVKTDPKSIDSLIAWLEKQPSGQEYNYRFADECLVAAYFKSAGIYEGMLLSHEVDELYGNTAVSYPWTYGDALARAREVRAQRNRS